MQKNLPSTTPVPSKLAALSPMLKDRINRGRHQKNLQRFKAEAKNQQTSILRKMEIAGQYGILNEG